MQEMFSCHDNMFKRDNNNSVPIRFPEGDVREFQVN